MKVTIIGTHGHPASVVHQAAIPPALLPSIDLSGATTAGERDHESDPRPLADGLVTLVLIENCSPWAGSKTPPGVGGAPVSARTGIRRATRQRP